MQCRFYVNYEKKADNHLSPQIDEHRNYHKIQVFAGNVNTIVNGVKQFSTIERHTMHVLRWDVVLKELR
jgi:hypothetical protein